MSEYQLLKAKVDAIQEGFRAIAERLSKINEAYQGMPAEAKAQLELDHESLSKLSWTAFKNGKGAWVFSDNVPYLKKVLLERGSIEIGSFRYRLSGTNDRFVVRYSK